MAPSDLQGGLTLVFFTDRDLGSRFAEVLKGVLTFGPNAGRAGKRTPPAECRRRPRAAFASGGTSTNRRVRRETLVKLLPCGRFAADRLLRLVGGNGHRFFLGPGRHPHFRMSVAACLVSAWCRPSPSPSRTPAGLSVGSMPASS